MAEKTLTPEQMAAAEAKRAKTARLTAIIQPLPDPRYTVDVGFDYLERQLAGYDSEWGGLNLDPDFQRGHVWSETQRSAYIEGVFRGTVGDSQRIIQFNAPHWNDDNHSGDLPNEIQIVDGLQRLTTIRMFMAGELRAFGMLVHDFDESSYSLKRSTFRLKFAIHNFVWRRDLLQYYLHINAGGTPHSASEIERVKSLLVECS